jgi:D-3-phosphoglycerate dehydrogenase
MKDGVRIVNCARGGIINEEDLCAAIESGKVAGAALDVYPKEPNENETLTKYAQLVLTPHIAASTGEAQSKVGIEIAKQMAEFLAKGTIMNAVNVAAMSPQLRQELLPFVDLSASLGRIAAQLAYGRITQLQIAYEGALEALDVQPITSALLCGALSYNTEGVNQVNARLLAEERGLKVSETKTAHSVNYANYIKVVASCEKGGEVSIGATIFGEDRQHPRIVRINHSHVDVVPEGHLLIVPHVDQPGLLGKVGTILGDHRINISRMTCDRLKPGADNVGVYTTDNPIPEEVVEQIRAIEGVHDAHRIVL